MSRGIPKKTVAAVLERDRGLCVLQISPACLRTATEADHRANRGHGGAKSGVLDQLSNLIGACGICNGHKESNADRAELLRRGVRVDGGRTHAHTAEKARAIPVEYPNGEVWWLDDDGNKAGQPF